MNILGCLAAFIAMALAYLCSRNQRLLARPIGPGGRIGAAVFAVVALIAWIAGETSLPGIFAAATALMFSAVALPYITWLFRPATARKTR
ncbi:hypothetical protein [Luteibacter sp. 3190]|uniref:hypothetical protein n=1 Tax=Luteibacter sp. 3190 TaxID=2817736 RepID=UPI00285C6F38|nr:hypothetical protein [Luteibacter sp. 3190]MDR6937549.1 hypothetical protein [Luteibacter sp. 3190]